MPQEGYIRYSNVKRKNDYIFKNSIDVPAFLERFANNNPQIIQLKVRKQILTDFIANPNAFASLFGGDFSYLQKQPNPLFELYLMLLTKRHSNLPKQMKPNIAVSSSAYGNALVDEDGDIEMQQGGQKKKRKATKKKRKSSPKRIKKKSKYIKKSRKHVKKRKKTRKK